VAKPDREEEFANLLETMKRAGAALRDAGIPHALAGGLAVWARGGPQTEHDVDFLVKPADAEPAQAALAEVGMRPVKPPEPWLLKAYDGDVMIDLIFAPSGGPVDDSWLGRAEEIEVAAMRMPVASLEDVLVTKLLSLSEQEPDYSAALEISRSVREQIRWDEVRERSDSSPLARAFFTLVEGLEIAPPPGASG
jgi:hypothetical protein